MVPSEASRLLLLEAQGLAGRPTSRAGPDEVFRLIQKMGFVQLDSINVLERAHHLTLWTRLEGYRRDTLKTLHEDRRLLFEHWTHDASLLPAEFLPHWRHRGHLYPERIRRYAWWQERLGGDPERLIREVREHVEKHGPVASKHLPGEGSGAWWGWKPEKAALEYLWRAGDLAVRQRNGFEKVYDLLERVHPEVMDRPVPDRREHVDWAMREGLARLGTGTASEIGDFWGGLTPQESREWARTAPERGLALRVRLETPGGRPREGLAVPDWEARLSGVRLPRRTRLLSPFDPVVRDRKRALRLFGFDYRFEAFVPAPKRVYGYYVLPVLEGDAFVARLDAKVHRKEGRLEVKGLWWEPGVRVTSARQARLDEALERLATFVGARR